MEPLIQRCLHIPVWYARWGVARLGFSRAAQVVEGWSAFLNALEELLCSKGIVPPRRPTKVAAVPSQNFIQKQYCGVHCAVAVLHLWSAVSHAPQQRPLSNAPSATTRPLPFAPIQPHPLSSNTRASHSFALTHPCDCAPCRLVQQWLSGETTADIPKAQSELMVPSMRGSMNFEPETDEDTSDTQERSFFSWG